MGASLERRPSTTHSRQCRCGCHKPRLRPLHTYALPPDSRGVWNEPFDGWFGRIRLFLNRFGVVMTVQFFARKFLGPVAMVLAAAAAPVHSATLETFDTRSSFIAATGATSATGALLPLTPIFTKEPGDRKVGHVTFNAPGWGIYKFSTLLAAVEDGGSLAISQGASDSGNQNNDGINATFDGLVYSAGYSFHEPTKSALYDGCNGPCVDSTWLIRLKNGSTTVGEVSSRKFPKDVATFFGVRSDVAFNQIQIREIVGTDDNEFYGQFYSAGAADAPISSPSAVPEPETYALMLAGLGLVSFMVRRGKSA